MNYKALGKAALSTLTVMLCFGMFLALITKFPMFVLGTILCCITLGALALIFVAYYDKYNK